MGYFNKDLDDIGFKLYEPNEKLKPYIYNYWSTKNSLEKEKTNKILSDGSLGFMINFSKPFRITLNEKTYFCSGKTTLMGQTKHPLFLTFNDYIDAIGVRFTVAGAYRFFDEKIESFLDKNINYDNSFWDFNSLYQDLENRKSNKEKIELFEEFLLKRLEASKKRNNPNTFDIVKFIDDRKGDISIESLCDEFLLSKRQIERIFKNEVGISAKLYSRIIRLRNVRDSLSSLEVDNLTSTAYDSGFFDQAHFIKEFKSFMKETPKNYYENKLTMAKLLNFKKFEA